VKKKLTFKETLYIAEMLNTKFNSITWKQDGHKDIGVGLLGDIKVQVVLTSITYDKHIGLNLTFGVWDGKDFSESAGTEVDANTTSIIGAVTNALTSRIEEYEWDFLTLIAKDNVDKRMKLYTRIADRLARESLSSQINERKSGAGVIVIGKKGIDIREIWDDFNSIKEA
jgi:hypothetical protein